MKKPIVTAIVTEYNPFHNGHLYHLQQARQITGCDVLIAIQSGNWVQRGEAACLNKWKRASAAVSYGVDLVVELPYLFATQSASEFCSGAVRIASLLHSDHLVFGSETNHLNELQEIASMSFDINRFRENLDAGYSYPKSYGYMAAAYGPNDILAIGYLKALQTTEIEPHSILRTNAYHDEELHPIASAKAIRKALLAHQDVSMATPMHDQLQPFATWEDYYPYLQTLLLTLPRPYLQQILLINEGIEQHLQHAARQADTFADFIELSTTRRYTRSRIQRTCLQILTQTLKQDKQLPEDMHHVRVLARNEIGQQYLKWLRKDETLTIANRFNQMPEVYRNSELRATRIYALGYPAKQRHDIIQQEIYGQYK